MKKALAIIFAAVTVFGCFGISVCAEEPTTTPSGFYVGQVLSVGNTFSSYYGANICSVTYRINENEVENVTSKLGSKYSPELTLTQFRDSITGGFTTEYGGIYTIKGYGDAVNSMMDNKGVFVKANDINTGGDEDFSINIDYKYSGTTLLDYMSISGWTVVNVKDTSEEIEITLEAVWATREPTKLEAFAESLYARYLVIRDIIRDIFGNYMLEALPKFLARWAQFLKDISKV